MLLEVNNVRKVYTTRLSTQSTEALKNVNFAVDNGEYVAIMGESGSGKTTLLNIIATFDKATSGNVNLNNLDLSKLKDKDLANFRRDNLGFVFQDFNLLDNFSIKDNILLPLVLANKKYKDMEKRLEKLSSRLKSWKTNPRLSRRKFAKSLSFSLLKSKLFKFTFPDVALSNVAIIFNKVVLPLPLSPIIATYSPLSTAKFTFFNASVL